MRLWLMGCYWSWKPEWMTWMYSAIRSWWLTMSEEYKQKNSISGRSYPVWIEWRGWPAKSINFEEDKAVALGGTHGDCLATQFWESSASHKCSLRAELNGSVCQISWPRRTTRRQEWGKENIGQSGKLPIRRRGAIQKREVYTMTQEVLMDPLRSRHGYMKEEGSIPVCPVRPSCGRTTH